MRSIKDIKAIRVLAKPYMDWKLKKNHEQYLRTPDHFYLQTLKGIHEGKRCFIIGNGPSLRASDLDMLKGEYTFAANRIFKIFDQTDWRPDYYLSVDDKFLKEAERELFSYDLGHMFLRSAKCTIHGPINRITKIYEEQLTLKIDEFSYNDTSLYISEDVSNHFCDARTVTVNSIQLAIYMGFKEIYLLGVDHNYSSTYDAAGKVHVDSTVQNYFDGKQYSGYPSAHLTHQFAYTIAREYCDTHVITIRNATRGGKLEVFERIELDKLLTRGGYNRVIYFYYTACFNPCAESED